MTQNVTHGQSGKRFTDRFVVTRKSGPKRIDIPEAGQTGLALRVAPSGRKTFQFRYRFDGRQRRLQLGEYPAMSLAEARLALADAQMMVARGTDPGAVKAEAKKAAVDAWTVDELIDAYLLGEASQRQSYPRIKRALEKDVLPKWTGRKAKDIRRRDVRRLLRGIVDRGAPVVANRTQSYIHRMFEFAISEEEIETNPCGGLERLTREKSRERYLDANEVRLFWRGLETAKISARARLALQLILVTAQRETEVVGMTRSEIDLSQRLWTLPRDRTKTKRHTHIVPLSDLAVGLITQLANSTNDDFLFPARQGSKSPHLAAGVLPRAVSRNRDVFDIATFTPHDLRRTASTHMGRLKVPRFIQDRILNHADSAIGGTYDRHEYLDEKREALDAWAAEIIRITRGPTDEGVVDFGDARER